MKHLYSITPYRIGMCNGNTPQSTPSDCCCTDCLETSRNLGEKNRNLLMEKRGQHTSRCTVKELYIIINISSSTYNSVCATRAITELQLLARYSLLCPVVFLLLFFLASRSSPSHHIHCCNLSHDLLSYSVFGALQHYVHTAI